MDGDTPPACCLGWLFRSLQPVFVACCWCPLNEEPGPVHELFEVEKRDDTVVPTIVDCVAYPASLGYKRVQPRGGSVKNRWPKRSRPIVH